MNRSNQRQTVSQGTDKHNKAERKHRPLKRGVSIGLTLIVLLIVIALIALAFRMFGGVDLTSSDIGNTSETSADSSSSPSKSENTKTAQSSNKSSSVNTTSTSASKTVQGSHYVQPANADWNLKLVNPWNPITSNYAQSLVTYAGDNKFDSSALDKLKALISASNGKIGVASLYRTIELQTTLFNREVNKYIVQGRSRTEAENIAATVVARPGTSEHNLGLAADFIFVGYPQLEQSNENTPTYTWLMAHCADYGFILRFPKSKQSVTGVTFEPWHYRYVGEEAARDIMSRGITLEEYLQEKGK